VIVNEVYMDGVIRIDKVVAMWEVWLDATFPFPKIKVNVLERSHGDFIAVPNLARRNATSGEAEFISGLRGNVEEAVSDLLLGIVSEVRERSPSSGLTAADFEWSAPEDS
jgi:hypothetical protein